MATREPIKILRDCIEQQIRAMWPKSWPSMKPMPVRIVAESVTFAEASELPSGYEDLMRNTYVSFRFGAQDGAKHRRRYRLRLSTRRV